MGFAGAAIATADAGSGAVENALAPAEVRDGWILLFDGSSFRGWRDPQTERPPGDSWEIAEGCLKTRLKPRITEDLITRDSFRDFELRFDWRLSPGANTGIKYRVQRLIFVDATKAQTGPGKFEGMLGRELAHPKSDRATMAPEAHGFEYPVAFEFQLIDDQRHADALKDAAHTTGALYAMLAPTRRAAHPAGSWNQSRLLVKGPHVEHWINGVQVLQASLDSQAVREGAAKRWAEAPAVGDMLAHARPEGRIGLQHHGDEVWFRNLKLRKL